MHERARSQLERFGVACVAACALLVFEFHKRLYLDVFGGTGKLLERELDATVDGGFSAPFQYRLLAPHTVELLRDAGLSAYDATAALDLVTLAIAAGLGVMLFRRLGRGWLLAVGAAWLAFVGIGAAYFPKPETYPSFAVITAATIVLADGRVHRAWLAPLALVQAFLRTDLLVALAAGFAVRWWFDRRRSDLVAGIGLVAIAGVATIAMMAAFPDAKYPDDLRLWQLEFNLTTESVAVLAALLVIPVFPLLVGSWQAVLATPDGRLGMALIAPHLLEVLMTLFVGRIMEVRIALPLVWSAGLGTCLLWQAVLADDGPGPREDARRRVDAGAS